MIFAGDEADQTAASEDYGTGRTGAEDELSASESIQQLEEEVEKTSGRPGKLFE